MRARKPAGPTAQERETVAIAAGGGMAHSDIACAMGISLAELRAKFDRELSVGAFESRVGLIRAMYDAGKKGNVAAAKAYLAFEPRSVAPPPAKAAARAPGEPSAVDPPAGGPDEPGAGDPAPGSDGPDGAAKPRKLGKKEQQQAAAVTAQVGSPWETLLPQHRAQ